MKHRVTTEVDRREASFNGYGSKSTSPSIWQVDTFEPNQEKHRSWLEEPLRREESSTTADVDTE